VRVRVRDIFLNECGHGRDSAGQIVCCLVGSKGAFYDRSKEHNVRNGREHASTFPSQAKERETKVRRTQSRRKLCAALVESTLPPMPRCPGAALRGSKERKRTTKDASCCQPLPGHTGDSSQGRNWSDWNGNGNGNGKKARERGAIPPSKIPQNASRQTHQFYCSSICTSNKR
jgi:hypothetical protein